jgi:hypothetical protein
LDKRRVGGCGIGVGRRARVVEGGENARRAFLFDKFADDLVVEELDGRPFYLQKDSVSIARRVAQILSTGSHPFTIVFLLFSFQRQFDEDLLTVTTV